MSEEDDYDPYWDIDDDEPCDHDDEDVDILTGRAHCYRCGEARWLTDKELRREIEIQAQMWMCFEEPVPTPEKDSGDGRE